jgi:hypothetical protein
MTDISNKTLAIIAGLALVVSVIGLFSLPDRSALAGLVTTGTTKINITQTAALNVSVATVNFGDGYLQVNANNCTITSLSSSGSSFRPASCWSNTTYTTGGFEVTNIGNVALNVTIVGTKVNASHFFGVTLGNGGAKSRYLFKCQGNGTSQASTFTNLNTTTKRCITNLPVGSGSDVFRTHINLTIPDTAFGLKTDTVTFTGTKA